jgi:hypothetical protein
MSEVLVSAQWRMWPSSSVTKCSRLLPTPMLSTRITRCL